MNLVLKTPTEAPFQAGKDFNVMIMMSSDGAAAERTCEILQLLRMTLKQEEGRLLYQTWALGTLAYFEIQEVAAKEAAMADLIMIGARDVLAEVEMVTDWVNSWVNLREGRPGAMVVVSDTDWSHSEAAQEVLAPLRTAVVSHQMDYFVTRAKEDRVMDASLLGVREVARQFVSRHRLVRLGTSCRALPDVTMQRV